MKLLLDENISFRIKYQLKTFFDDIIHVTLIQKGRLTDNEIWEFAKKNDFLILTYDREFQ